MSYQLLRENLSFLKERYNLNNRELATEIKVARKTVAAWFEFRAIDPQLIHLKKISDYFRISIDDLCKSTIRNIHHNTLHKNYRTVQSYLKL